MGGQQRVLVVEDEDDIRESVCGTLRDDGYDTVGSATLADARTAIERESFDVIVLDLWLPDGNGDLILRTLAARQSPPVIVVASAATAAPGIARRFGVGFVRKPYDLSALVEAVKTAVKENLVPATPPPSSRPD